MFDVVVLASVKVVEVTVNDKVDRGVIVHAGGKRG